MKATEAGDKDEKRSLTRLRLPTPQRGKSKSCQHGARCWAAGREQPGDGNAPGEIVSCSPSALLWWWWERRRWGHQPTDCKAGCGAEAWGSSSKARRTPAGRGSSCKAAVTYRLPLTFCFFHLFWFVSRGVFCRGACPFWNAHSRSAAQHKWVCFPSPPLTDTLEVDHRAPRGLQTPGLKTSTLMLILSVVQFRKCDYFTAERTETKKGDAKKQEWWGLGSDLGARSEAGFPMSLSDAMEVTPKVFPFH